MYLICHMTSQDHTIKGLCRFMDGNFSLCHHPSKFGDQRYCDSENMFLICHVTARNQMFKGLCEFIDGCPSQ